MDVSDDLIATGLSRVDPEPGRLTVKTTSNRANLIDDTYNANPGSMRAALATLAEVGAEKKKAAVLGDMLELGDQAEAAHLEIGRLVVRSGIDQLVTLGDLGRLVGEGAKAAGLAEAKWQHVPDHEAATTRSVKTLTSD